MAHTSEEERLEGHNKNKPTVEKKLNNISKRKFGKIYRNLKDTRKSQVWLDYWKEYGIETDK